MRNVEITMTKRLAVDFDVTDEEIEMLRNGEVPDRIQEELDGMDWNEGWQDYAVWDNDNEEQLVEWTD